MPPNEITNITSMTSTSNSKMLTTLTIVLYLLVFLIGFLAVLKYVKKSSDTNNVLKILSYIVAPIGIILYFVNVKNKKDVALDYLKAGIIGIAMYLFIVLVAILINLLHWKIVIAY